MEINKDEVSALMTFSANKGIELSSDICTPLIHYLEPDSELAEVEVDVVNKPLAKDEPTLSQIHTAYSKLNKLTKPVTGSSILASRNAKINTWPLIAITILFVILVLGNEIVSLVAEDGDVAPDSWLHWLINFQKYILDILVPLFWGGLGSCIYLLKRISDVASEYTFHPDRLGGWGTRITLGAVLGGVIQYIYDPANLTSTGIDNNALAFLVGLSIKVVYGALEKTVAVLGEKMNLDNTKSSSKDKKTFEEMAVNMVADKNTSVEKRKMIMDLINMDDK